MTIQIQVFMRPDLYERWHPHLLDACAAAGLDAAFGTDLEPASADYLIYAPHQGDVDLGPYTNARAAFGIWAGVETIISNPTLTIPYARMVDEGLTDGMVEWVLGHVMRHHIGMDADICRNDGQWAKHLPKLARERSVGVLGLGELGTASVRMLRDVGFRVAGWSRRPKQIEGVDCFAGEAGLDAVLARSEILVLLLPLTPATEDLMNAARLAQLPAGAVVLNPGRGGLIDDDALLAALDSGHIGHATLDTFRVEPLPEDHPFWAHPRVTVTPHIASETRPVTAAPVIAENIRRAEAGEPLLNLVDRAAGY